MASSMYALASSMYALASSMYALASSMYALLPDFETARADLGHVPPIGPEDPFYNRTSWKGMALRWHVPGPAEGGDGVFSCSYWCRLTAEHWEIPLVAVALYIVMMPLLKLLVSWRGKFDVRTFAFWWNTVLSVFSCCGVVACVPVLLTSLQEHGLFFTMCAPATWYGSGVHGVFVMLFIYSKLVELLDHALLLLAGKPVITLQWWHHLTVLLFCWHSYAVRIATGAWFACMNYVEHSLMYGYFALMATKYRKRVAPFGMLITLLQILQMVVGMFIILKAMMYQAAGEECYVNKTNSILGLAMYASYFVLFCKLFVDKYASYFVLSCKLFVDNLFSKQKWWKQA